jgi:hypothetical protein
MSALDDEACSGVQFAGGTGLVASGGRVFSSEDFNA